MPKRKQKGKSGRRRNEGSLQTSDDESYNDNASVVSNYSENKSVEDGEEGANGDELAQDQLEEKLIEIIDGLTQKSACGRTTSICSMCKVLVNKYMPNFVRDRHFSLCDSVERSLKKGGVAEKSAAADMASLLCIQLGLDDAGESVYKTLRPTLMSLAYDNAVSPAVRAKCCLAVGIMAFIFEDDLEETLSLMQSLESIYSGSYLKGDGTTPNVTAEQGNLHAAALSSWTLLVSGISSELVADLIDTKPMPTLEQLSELLESPHLEVRLTAGEALALIFEKGRESGVMLTDSESLETLAGAIEKLAKDSHKYRAKKDRKQQRATFRDILQFLNEDLVPDVKIKFGREAVALDTWARRKQYDALCSILGPGINSHLSENFLLRDIFNITSPVLNPKEIPAHAQHQMERYRKKITNAAAFKARTISRAKNRNKRADF